jgi:hypothetical protein
MAEAQVASLCVQDVQRDVQHGVEARGRGARRNHQDLPPGQGAGYQVPPSLRKTPCPVPPRPMFLGVREGGG